MSLVALAAALSPLGGTAVQAGAIPLAQPHVKASHIKVQPFGVKPKISASDWTPQTLAEAYGVTWSPTLGAGKTIAIIDAFDSPNVEADLAVFSSANSFNLPACTTANGCFKKVNQVGNSSPLPAYSAEWAMEIGLDVQWVHAMAPGAKILLVEARDNSFDNLNAAVQYANNVSDAMYISNSWGAPEFKGQNAYDTIFTPKPGKSMLFASGDDGLGAGYPSSAPNVVSVGGTTLSKSGSTYTESVWVDGGGGCSKYEAVNPKQLAFSQYKQAGCSKKKPRATPDISAIADPATGVLVYLTPPAGASSWLKVGGTSLATPVVAAIAAGAGITLNADTIYSPTFQFRDANKAAVKKAKSNGAQCKVGFDMCTGRGSIIGLAGATGANRWR